ncbi:MAG: ABC transporter ATP-binding protein [Candidatus Binatia bacterium]
MPTPGEAIRCRGVCVRYEDPPAQALRGVNLLQREGEVVAVLGATGAGKSTLLKCVNRIVPELRHAAIEGEVRVFGESVDRRRVSELAGTVGFVFQDFEAQLFSTSVREEIVFGLEQLAVPPAEMDPRVTRALRAVGLEGFEGRDPTTLSGGEKQRLAIGSILALEPALLLLDEPSTDLDPAGRREIFERLRQLRSTLLVAEHDVESMLAADRIVVLHEGAVALDGVATDVLARPRELEALGVRPPELSSVCAALGLGPWPLDVDSVEARMRAAGMRIVDSAPDEPGAAGEVILEARSLRFRYPESREDALRDVGLELREGEFLALVGSNGSGKTTLARHLNGLLEPRAGSVVWRGRPLRTLSAPERAAAVGYVFQNPDEQIFAATVEEEVAFGPLQIGLTAPEVRRRVEGALAAVGLEGLAGRDPFLLGKGERQRVAVASILALSPAVLILDEPTTGLDYRETLSLFEVLRRLNAEGRTIVVITHVPWVVAAYARRVVLMSRGAVLWDGAVRGLFEREDLCEAGDFVPPDVTRLGRRFGSTPLTPEELLSCLRRG